MDGRRSWGIGFVVGTLLPFVALAALVLVLAVIAVAVLVAIFGARRPVVAGALTGFGLVVLALVAVRWIGGVQSDTWLAAIAIGAVPLAAGLFRTAVPGN